MNLPTPTTTRAVQKDFLVIRLFLMMLGLAVAAFLTHAVFAVFYERDAFLYVAPILFALVAGAFAIVPLRLRWNWRLVWHWSWSWPLLQVVFSPDAAHFGALVTPARILAAVEVVACLAVLLTMRHEAVQAWFAARGRVAS